MCIDIGSSGNMNLLPPLTYTECFSKVNGGEREMFTILFFVRIFTHSLTVTGSANQIESPKQPDMDLLFLHKNL